MQCTYRKIDGSTCTREAISGRGLCILHEDWEHKTIEETMKVFYREIEEGEGNFQGCIIAEFDLSSKIFKNQLSFIQATIEGDARFLKATIKRAALFYKATIKGDARFDKATIEGDAQFCEATIKGDARFDEATIEGYAQFDKATIEGDAQFYKATIKGDARFYKATIKRDALFYKATIEGDARFDEATLEGKAWFGGAQLRRRATFEEAIFRQMEAQEQACRLAKITQDRVGNRELADYHFYREMEARRKQKERFIRWLESPIQFIFGYGVHPFRVICWWLSVVFILALAYWLGHGVHDATTFWEHLYFSVVTSATPGYGGYKPEPGVFQILATIQAIFGTFMWAAFIVTFARKFMR